MTNLMAAHHQWAKRAADERFFTVDEMMDASAKCQAESSTLTLERKDIRFDTTTDGGIACRIGDTEVEMTNFAFSKVCSVINAPVNSLVGKISPETMADILNERAERSNDEHTDDDGVSSEIEALIRSGTEGVTLRTITSSKYARLWNTGLNPMFKELAAMGYRVPPCRPVDDKQPRIRPAMADEVGMWGNAGVQIRDGDPIAPGNVYCSDRNMFVLMVNPGTATDDGFGNGLMSGIIVSNSEVGERSVSVLTFTLQSVCGNAILWDCSNIRQNKFKHMGKVNGRVNDCWESLKRDGAIAVSDRIKRVLGIMNSERLGNTADDVVDTLYRQRLAPALTQRVLRSAIVNAEAYTSVDGDPFTLRGMTNALTRYSQSLPNTDDRMEIDAAVATIYANVAKIAAV